MTDNGVYLNILARAYAAMDPELGSGDDEHAVLAECVDVLEDLLRTADVELPPRPDTTTGQPVDGDGEVEPVEASWVGRPDPRCELPRGWGDAVWDPRKGHYRTPRGAVYVPAGPPT